MFNLLKWSIYNSWRNLSLDIAFKSSKAFSRDRGCESLFEKALLLIINDYRTSIITAGVNRRVVIWLKEPSYIVNLVLSQSKSAVQPLSSSTTLKWQRFEVLYLGHTSIRRNDLRGSYCLIRPSGATCFSFIQSSIKPELSGRSLLVFTAIIQNLLCFSFTYVSWFYVLCKYCLNFIAIIKWSQ